MGWYLSAIVNKFALSVTLAAFAAAVADPQVAAAEITGKGFPLRNGAAAPYAAPAAPITANAPANAAAAPAPLPAAVAAATTTQPQTQASFENSPLSFAGENRVRNRQANGENRGYSMPSIWPALLAVGGLCGFFGLALFVMKKYLPGHRQLFNHPAMELLGRTHLDQRRFVTLLRVGRRLVVVGVCQEEMRTLCEITDSSEVTEIMEIARPKTEVGLTVFQRLFQKTVVEAEAEETRAMAREKVAELDAQMSALRARVHEIHSDEDMTETAMNEKRRQLAVDKLHQLDAVG